MQVCRHSFILTCCAILLIGAGLLYWDWHRFLQQPFTKVSGDYIYQLRAGYTLNMTARDLLVKDLLTHARYRYYLVLLGKLTGEVYQLKAGEYLLTPAITAPQLLTDMANGNVVLRKITLVEGWNFWQIRDAIIANPYIKDELVHLPAAQLLKVLELVQTHIEGLFFPETYQFARGVSDKVILQQAAALMQEKLRMAWLRRQSGLPYQTSYDVLIAASIIEKETAIVAERPIVSSVIVNRLRKGMRLQVDPTVIYGLGEHFEGPLTRADLRKDTPHNTYRRKGLPPTPIAIPSESALLATVQPAATQYYYFVARGDGSHEFSVTLEQQNAAVRRYIRNKPTVISPVATEAMVRPVQETEKPEPLETVVTPADTEMELAEPPTITTLQDDTPADTEMELAEPPAITTLQDDTPADTEMELAEPPAITTLQDDTPADTEMELAEPPAITTLQDDTQQERTDDMMRQPEAETTQGQDE
jgi:peptidoglycan lytic transglycosylase G